MSRWTGDTEDREDGSGVRVGAKGGVGDGDDSAGRRAGRGAGWRVRLVVLALAALVLLVVLYLLAVQTGWGQRVDGAALSGRVFSRPRLRRITYGVLRTISVSALALLGAAVVTIALVRGRVSRALVAVTVIAGANVTTQVLKHAVLPRPDLVAGPLGTRPTFPSGHTTVAMSLAVALVVVVGHRHRLLAGLVGAGYAAAVGGATLTAGWHRPSDVIGAYLVVVVWAAPATALLAGPDGRPGDGRPGRDGVDDGVPLLAAVGVALLGVAFAAAAAYAVVRRSHELAAVDFRAPYFAGLAAIAGSALLTMAAFLHALGREFPQARLRSPR